MSKKDDALKLALEALDHNLLFTSLMPGYDGRIIEKAYKAINKALDQQPAQGCEFCSHPLYAGTKCKNCGKPAQQDIPKIGCVNHDCDKCKARQQEPVRVPVTDNTYNYAKSLAEAIFKQHFASDEHYSSGRIVWGVNDTVIGILTQIDNMVADMVRRPAQQQEPVAWLKVIETPGGWGKFVEAKPHEKGAKPVYTSPPNVPTAQPSKPLTDEQVHEGGRKTDPDGEDLCYWSFKQGVRFAEAAHGIKGDA